MRGTITISSSFGAGGAFIGPAVATELGLKFFDRAIPAAVARELHLDENDAFALDSKAPGRFERLLAALSNVSLPIGIPDLSGDLVSSPNRFKEATEQVLRQIAEGEGGVVLGRAGMVVLADRPDVLSVRLAGPAEDRVAQTVARGGGDEGTVRAEQKATDAAREAYVQAFYNVRQSDPTLYHLIIDSTVISYDACTEIIVAAAKDRFHAT